MTEYHKPKLPSDFILNLIREKYTYIPETGVIINNNKNTICTGKSCGYVQISVHKRKKYYGHHIAWFLYYGTWPEQLIDHKDRCRSNNIINNLRYGDGKIQHSNKPPREHDLTYINESKYGKGIYFRKGRFEVYFTRYGMHHYLGVFRDIGNAKRAIDEFNENV